jgi:hypothetical protein
MCLANIVVLIHDSRSLNSVKINIFYPPHVPHKETSAVFTISRFVHICDEVGEI